MNHLASVRINNVFNPTNDEETEFEKFHELIFLVSQADYTYSNEGSIVRTRRLVEQRFFVSAKNLPIMMEEINKLTSAKPSELG